MRETHGKKKKRMHARAKPLIVSRRETMKVFFYPARILTSRTTLRKPVGLCAAKRAIQGSKRAALCALRIGNQIFHFKSIQGPKRAALQTLQLILQSDKN